MDAVSDLAAEAVSYVSLTYEAILRFNSNLPREEQLKDISEISKQVLMNGVEYLDSDIKKRIIQLLPADKDSGSKQILLDRFTSISLQLLLWISKNLKPTDTTSSFELDNLNPISGKLSDQIKRNTLQRTNGTHQSCTSIEIHANSGGKSYGW